MKTFLIIAGCILVVVLLSIRFLFTGSVDANLEREWFASNLRYKFSAIIDTAASLRGNTGPGKAWCRLASGTVPTMREDSLCQFLKSYKSLDFITRQSGDSVTLFLLGADRFLPGDSLYVDSKKNEIQFFRAGKVIAADLLSATLEGRGTMLSF